MKSWNILFTGVQKAELVQEELPTMKEDEVLCRTERTLISIGTESHCYRGVFDSGTNWESWVKYPFYPGYSNVATVVEVGSAVTDLKPGDRVRSEWQHRQYFVSPTNVLYKIPDDVDTTEATWVVLAGVAQRCVRKCQIQFGDSVVIIGQGPVGQLTTQFVRACGALDIIAIDPVASKAEAAKLSGATHVLNSTAGEAVEAVKEITNGKLADVVIDTTGHPAVLAQACLLVRVNGKLGLVGDTVTPSRQVLGPGVISKSITILGSGGSTHMPTDTPFYPWGPEMASKNLVEWNQNLTVRFLQQRKLDFRHLVSHVVSPKEAPVIYDKLLNNRDSYQGVVFDWSLLD